MYTSSVYIDLDVLVWWSQTSWAACYDRNRAPYNLCIPPTDKWFDREVQSNTADNAGEVGQRKTGWLGGPLVSGFVCVSYGTTKGYQTISIWDHVLQVCFIIFMSLTVLSKCWPLVFLCGYSIITVCVCNFRIRCLSTENVTLKFVDVQVQKRKYDCGLFAVAFATALLHGKQPGNFKFQQSLMRKHLDKCITSGNMSDFPAKPRSKDE